MTSPQRVARLTWQSEGEHCASVGYPYSLVEEWVGSWAGWRWCADHIYQLQLLYRPVFISCLCCVRMNIVHLIVSKVIYVGMARLEMRSKQVCYFSVVFCFLIFLNWRFLVRMWLQIEIYLQKRKTYKHFYMPLGRLSYRLGVRGIVFRSPGGASDSLDLEVTRVVLGSSQPCVPRVPGPFVGGKAAGTLSWPLTSI